MHRNDIIRKLKQKATVQIIKEGDEFHWKPFNAKHSTTIPAELFVEYVEARTAYLEYKKELETYFQPIKVNEGEIHRLP